MPYIPRERRRHLDSGQHTPTTVGELTYLIQQSIKRFIEDPGAEPLSYRRCTEVLGALEGAKADFVRRILEPYEVCKQVANGDVW